MSIPGVDIICSHCDYSGSTAVVFGIFKYQTPLGKISVPRTLGWCHSCDSTAPINCADKTVKRESLADDIESLEISLLEELEHAEKSRSFVTRLFSSKLRDNNVIRQLRSELNALKCELDQPSILSDYLTSPQKPHCLSCGSTNVFQFPEMPRDLDDFDSNDRTPKPIGVEHPDCGGQMYAQVSDIRINRRFSERLYTLDGERIA